MILLIIFAVALILRLSLSSLGFHVDILSNAAWGKWIFENGAKGFYENNIWIYAWPTQPPLVSLLYGFDRWLYINLLEIFRSVGNIIVQYHLAPGHMRWWFEFTKWFDTGKTSEEAVFSTGYLVSIKVLPILSDLGIAAVIYKVARKIKNIKYPSVWAAVYLFSPFTFYLSSLWGQYDQVSFLPLIIAFILESNKKAPWLTPFLFALSIAIKPTSLILLPLFIYLYLKNKHSLIEIAVSIGLILVLFISSTQPFTDKNVFIYSQAELYEKIFLKSATRLSANTFNFWNILQSSAIQTQESKILFIPACIWGYIAFIVLNFIAFKNLKNINTKNVVSGIFIVSAGSWIFMTNMLDRYFFAGVVSGLVVTLFYPKLFKYWLIISVLFLINLYNKWWFPNCFDCVKQALLSRNELLTKVFSIINIAVFVQMTTYILKENKSRS